MSVRKLIKTRADGSTYEAWLVDYRDSKRVRHTETFETKKAADARETEIKTNITKGVHVAPSSSLTVAEAAESWLESCRSRIGITGKRRLVRSTVKNYTAEVGHVLRHVGHVKLACFPVSLVYDLAEKLRKESGSDVLVDHCINALGYVFTNAIKRGQCVVNPVREYSKAESGGINRDSVKLRVGIHIPTTHDVKAIIDQATNPRWRMIMMMAAFTGLRSSELRALCWHHINFAKNELHVAEKVDRYREVGKPKSTAGDRIVPLPKFLVTALKEYKLAMGGSDLVFPAEKASHLSASTLKKCCVDPAVKAAKPFFEKDGKQKLYRGMHMFRHYYASLCINPPSLGGLGLSPHAVQERLGHSSVTITLNRYGHLFPKQDDGGALDKIGADLFGRA